MSRPDIVDELLVHKCCGKSHPKVCDEAAKEITMVRILNDRLIEVLRDNCPEIYAIRAEDLKHDARHL